MRLSVLHTEEQTALRAGRQALQDGGVLPLKKTGVCGAFGGLRAAIADSTIS
jgi:hypothetical protein